MANINKCIKIYKDSKIKIDLREHRIHLLSESEVRTHFLDKAVEKNMRLFLTHSVPCSFSTLDKFMVLILDRSSEHVAHV